MATVALAGCASFDPGRVPVGTPVAEVLRTQAGLTGDHALPNGGRRLEYARGAFGRETFMLDFDAQGRLVGSRQVMGEADFATIVPGMAADEVRLRLGRPAWIFNVGRQHLSVWNYRWFRGDCVWFQVSVSDAGAVTEAAYGQDPACDGPNGARD